MHQRPIRAASRREGGEKVGARVDGGLSRWRVIVDRHGVKPAARAGLDRKSTSASSRLVSTEYPRRGRGVAAIRRRDVHAARDRRRAKSSSAYRRGSTSSSAPPGDPPSCDRRSTTSRGRTRPSSRESSRRTRRRRRARAQRPAGRRGAPGAAPRRASRPETRALVRCFRRETASPRPGRRWPARGRDEAPLKDARRHAAVREVAVPRPALRRAVAHLGEVNDDVAERARPRPADLTAGDARVARPPRLQQHLLRRP